MSPGSVRSGCRGQWLGWLLWWLALAVPPVVAGEAELQHLLAPVALYPDRLLEQVLEAARRPEEVTEAARWRASRGEVSAEQAARVAAERGWSPALQNLLAFPDLLARMAEHPDWTRLLGRAWVDDRAVLLRAVQQLRDRADRAGSLVELSESRVERRDGWLVILALPGRALRLPWYDPVQVYGPWRRGSPPPVSWRPAPGLTAQGRFYWGPPRVGHRPVDTHHHRSPQSGRYRSPPGHPQRPHGALRPGPSSRDQSGPRERSGTPPFRRQQSDSGIELRRGQPSSRHHGEQRRQAPRSSRSH